jgi:hypothetical protein
MKEITIDGVDYKLVKLPPKPEFTKYDVVQFYSDIDNTNHIITEVASDRYYIHDSDHYIMFEGQHKFHVVGKASLAIEIYQPESEQI